MEKIINLTQRKFDLQELKNKIPSDYLIVFFSPVEWIEEIGKEVAKNYKNSIGASSYKDITKEYAQYESVSFIGIKYENVKLELLKDIDKRVITYYDEIASLKKIYKKNHSVLLQFTDGLSLAEESVLTVITNELGNIPVIGGSAADGGKFIKTKVCVNGVSLENATALCMLTTSMKIDIYCENIYKPTSIKGIITDSSLFEREIHKISGLPAIEFYCNKLGISKNCMDENFISHPIARIIGDRYFITSIKGVKGNSFEVYARSFNHSYISICDPINYVNMWKETANNHKGRYLGGIFVNCVIRTNLFEKENTMKDFQKYLNSYGKFICMTSYGEQYCDSHANQTMIACLFRE